MRENSQTAPGLARQLTEAYVALSKAEEVWHYSLTQSLRHITRTCANVLGVERASVWQLSADMNTLECLCLYLEDVDGYERGTVIQARAYPRYFTALTLERVIDAGDGLRDPRTRELAESYLKPLSIASLLDGTLRYEGKPGACSVWNRWAGAGSGARTNKTSLARWRIWYLR